MKPFIYLLCFITLNIPAFLKAQNIHQNSGWSALFHSQKFSDKVGAHFDFQIRSADDFEYVRNILIRPGVTWFIDNSKNATLGYAFILTNQRMEGVTDHQLTESRIWEQFVYNQKIGKVPLTHRLRLEQRFIETNTDDVFSNRIRYFLRSVLPLNPQSNTKFNNGLFIALQNEVFINLQNKEKLNGHTFDQNRAYLAMGYRLNPKMDIEVGYLNQAIKGQTNHTINNAVQLAFYTRF